MIVLDCACRLHFTRYLVNTQFPRPHGTSDISSVTFSPTPSAPGTSSNPVSTPDPYLLTTSTDGVAKIWHVRQSGKSEQGKQSFTFLTHVSFFSDENFLYITVILIRTPFSSEECGDFILQS